MHQIERFPHAPDLILHQPRIFHRKEVASLWHAQAARAAMRLGKPDRLLFRTGIALPAMHQGDRTVDAPRQSVQPRRRGVINLGFPPGWTGKPNGTLRFRQKATRDVVAEHLLRPARENAPAAVSSEDGIA